jgi:hypothetical protein
MISVVDTDINSPPVLRVSAFIRALLSGRVLPEYANCVRNTNTHVCTVSRNTCTDQSVMHYWVPLILSSQRVHIALGNVVEAGGLGGGHSTDGLPRHGPIRRLRRVRYLRAFRIDANGHL